MAPRFSLATRNSSLATPPGLHSQLATHHSPLPLVFTRNSQLITRHSPRSSLATRNSSLATPPGLHSQLATHHSPLPPVFTRNSQLITRHSPRSSLATRNSSLATPPGLHSQLATHHSPLPPVFTRNSQLATRHYSEPLATPMIQISVMVSRTTSSMVVCPRLMAWRPDSRRVRMPYLRQALRNSSSETSATTISRRLSFMRASS